MRSGGSADDRRPPISQSYARIYAVVERIPPGRVATYGQVAAICGLTGRARQVGYALHSLPPGSELAWHRVINAKGQVSPRADGPWAGIQRQLLEAEGIDFDGSGTVDLERFRWEPKTDLDGRPD